ncbi:MAG: hypothetical protein ACK5JR_11475 [Tropicimonas sp.]|uniref:hypothetical protein n=1 Tax=Tropicimonas sp. TaxID=2067044 RepID=UPI003A867962
MTDSALHQLFDLLEQEKFLLMKGEIEAVAEMAARKEELVERLHPAALLAAEDLSKLRDMAQRNGALLDASRKGLKAAATRLGEIRKAMLNLDTYNRNGDLKNLQDTRPRIEKRA